MTTTNNILTTKCTDKYGFIYLLSNDSMNLKVESIFRPIRKIGCVYGQSRSVNDRLNDFNKHDKSTDPTTKWYPIVVWKVPQNVIEKESWLFNMLENRSGIKRLSREGKKSEQFIVLDDNVNIINASREIMKFIGTEFYFQDKIQDKVQDKIQDKVQSNPKKNIKIFYTESNIINTQSKKRGIVDMYETKETKKRRKNKTSKDRLYKYLHPPPSKSTPSRFGSLRQAKQIIYDTLTDFGITISFNDNFCKDFSDEWKFVLPDGRVGMGIKKLLLRFQSILIEKSFGSKHFIQTTIGKFHFECSMKFIKKLRNNYVYNNGLKFTSSHLIEFKKDFNGLLSLNSNLSLINQYNWANSYNFTPDNFTNILMNSRNKFN